MQPHIAKVLYKNALATCIAYSPMRNDKFFTDQKSNIDETNAIKLQWFSDTPSTALPTIFPLDVFAGAGLKLFGGSSTVDSYGRVQCSNPAFIEEALKSLGYTFTKGDAASVFSVMCSIGFRRDAVNGNDCAGGTGSWDRRELGNDGAALSKVLKVAKFSAIPALTDAELYWLGYTSFKSLCDIDILTGSANITQGVTTIKTYNGNAENPAMVDTTAKFGPSPKSFSGAMGNDMYTTGSINGSTSNFPPGTISAGQGITGSVRIGTIYNGCVAFATDGVNKYANAYLAWARLNTEAADPAKSPTDVPPGEDGIGTTCAIEGIGWLICPVISFMASLADSAFSFLSKSFLSIDPDLLSTDNGTYMAWSVMRNIANIAFVIAFLFIIFSQLTGQGIANYGIKKMLPRLVISAILVNISFYVCQAAVDISNILGFSLHQVFVSVGGGITLPEGAVMGDEGGNWVGIAAAVLTGGVIAWALGVSVLLPLLLGALVALIMVFVILVLREVLIILLIAIAPIAFVAFLLPNTEQWFTKWRKMFVALLLIFPMIGLLFGAAGLASTILESATYSADDGASAVIGRIVAAAIIALPLFLLPSLLKGSLNSVGNIGAKINGFSSKLSKGAQNKSANSGLMKNYAARKAERRTAIATGTYKGRNPISKLRTAANRGLNNSGVFNAVTSGYGADRTLAGQGQQRKDAQEAMSMFAGNDSLVEAWASSGGDFSKVPSSITSGMTADQQTQLKTQFTLMKNAGHDRKPTSFLAAAQYLSENGKGSAEAVQESLRNASKAGASSVEVGSAGAAAVAAYRKSGRGDALATLSTSTGIGAMTQEQGWAQVAPSAVHRDGIGMVDAIDPTTGKVIINPTTGKAVKTKSAGLVAYENHLQSTPEHTRQALTGFDSMEQRAREKAQQAIIDAAQTHQYTATGVAPTITNIREAKDYFGVK
ncbi:MAG: hypothetical protein V4611_02135 [Patescibacteria group bacterium]